MLIKRETLEAVQEETDNGSLWFAADRLPRGTIGKELDELIHKAMNTDYDGASDEKIMGDTVGAAFELGLNAQRGTDLIGEDVWFCRRVRAKGFGVYVDCGCQVKHCGNAEYHIGHCVEALDQQKKIEQAKTAEKSEAATHEIETPEVPCEL